MSREVGISAQDFLRTLDIAARGGGARMPLGPDAHPAILQPTEGSKVVNSRAALGLSDRLLNGDIPAARKEPSESVDHSHNPGIVGVASRLLENTK